YSKNSEKFSVGGGINSSWKINWIKWDHVCKLRDQGGLGVKDVRSFNLALIGKWNWRLFTEVRVFGVKCLLSFESRLGNPNDDRLTRSYREKVVISASCGWLGIVFAEDLVGASSSKICNRCERREVKLGSRSSQLKQSVWVRDLDLFGHSDSVGLLGFRDDLVRRVEDGSNTRLWLGKWLEYFIILAIIRMVTYVILGIELGENGNGISLGGANYLIGKLI
ncbi:hypothetical protein Lal_00027918, partial [Lupinus albus]